MKHAVRALSWAIWIFWIAIIAFTGTAIYSALDVQMSLGEPRISSSDASLIVSFPVAINNTSYYDLSEFNMTSNVMDRHRQLLSASITLVPLIPHGQNRETMHTMSLELGELFQREPSHLFNDTSFDVNMYLKLRYAYAFAFQVTENTTIEWGAPLYNFTTGPISYMFHNSTHQTAYISVSFENHSAFFNVTGTIRLEIYNDANDLIGSGALDVDVPQHSPYENHLEILVNSSKLTESAVLHFYFETSAFSFGPWVTSYG